MSKVHILMYKSEEEYSHNISEVLLVARNKKQLINFSERLKQFVSANDQLIVLTPNRLNLIENHLVVFRQSDSDENYNYLQDDLQNKNEKTSKEQLFKVKNSLTASDFNFIFQNFKYNFNSFKESYSILKNASINQKRASYWQKNKA